MQQRRLKTLASALWSAIKERARSLSARCVKGWKAASAWTHRDGNPRTDAKPPYTHCLNCGEELQGMFCHKCGQQATSPVPSMWNFLVEYINNSLAIDHQAVPTLTNLFFHPGRLAKEYSLGRRLAFLHPLKLNLFILILLVMSFSLFSTQAKVEGTVIDITHDDRFLTIAACETVIADTTYFERALATPREVVCMAIDAESMEHFTQLITVEEMLYSTAVEGACDTLLVSLPSLLLEDQVFLVDEHGLCTPNGAHKLIAEGYMLDAMREAWSRITRWIFGHFPLLILLTTPIFSLVLRLSLRRYKIPRSHIYIFSLYYLAYIELLMLIAFLLTRVVDLPSGWIVRVGALVLMAYLACALKHAFPIPSWKRAGLLALLMNVVYFGVAAAIAFMMAVIFVISLSW